MSERHIGDYRGMAATHIHDQWLPSEDGANRIANVLANAMDIDPPEIIFTHEHHDWVTGSVGRRKWYIRLHVRGEDMGTLIHCLAHLVQWRRDHPKFPWRHDETFKRVEREMVEGYLQSLEEGEAAE